MKEAHPAHGVPRAASISFHQRHPQPSASPPTTPSARSKAFTTARFEVDFFEKMLCEIPFLLTTLLATTALAFAPPVATTRMMATTTMPATATFQMMDHSLLPDFASSSGMMLLAETEPWVQPLSLVLDPALNLLSFAMLCRVVLSWYPSTNLNETPWNFVAWPTEPLLKVLRGSIPPAFGVDITPIVWLGFFTFVHEILLGQQGLLTIKMKYGI